MNIYLIKCVFTCIVFSTGVSALGGLLDQASSALNQSASGGENIMNKVQKIIKDISGISKKTTSGIADIKGGIDTTKSQIEQDKQALQKPNAKDQMVKVPKDVANSPIQQQQKNVFNQGPKTKSMVSNLRTKVIPKENRDRRWGVFK